MPARPNNSAHNKPPHAVQQGGCCEPCRAFATVRLQAPSNCSLSGGLKLLLRHERHLDRDAGKQAAVDGGTGSRRGVDVAKRHKALHRRLG